MLSDKPPRGAPPPSPYAGRGWQEEHDHRDGSDDQLPDRRACAAGVRRAAGRDHLESALGFTEPRHEGKRLGILPRDAVELHVWVADGSAPGAERQLAGTASCRVEVDGVDALYEHCRRHGVVPPNAPLTSTPWGTREFGVLDPDNNLISLYERVDA